MLKSFQSQGPHLLKTESSDNSTEYFVNIENAALCNSQSQKKINFWFIITAWLCLQNGIIRTNLVGVASAQGSTFALGDATALLAVVFCAAQVARNVGAGGVPVPCGRGR